MRLLLRCGGVRDLDGRQHEVAAYSTQGKSAGIDGVQQRITTREVTPSFFGLLGAEAAIGLDGHEWVNFVRGNKTPLAPGMRFSNEPMIAIYGEFGIRLEDCMYMTQDGARFFSQQSPAIDKPFA